MTARLTRCSLARAFAAALLAAGCNGTITGDGSSRRAESGSDSPGLEAKTPQEVLASPECQTPQPGRAPLRRLSNSEYANTLKDLFAGISGLAAEIDAAVAGFPAESESLGFRNNADFLSVGSLVAQKYLDAAEVIAEKAAAAAGFLPCSPQTAGELECARQFIASFGARVYRRQLSEAEKQSYEGAYSAAAADYDFGTGIEWVTFAMLQSTPFLYRVELGRASSGGYTQPTPFEMASRLSYLVWQSGPDQALLDAAAAGQLETAAELEAQARRLLQDPKSERLLEYFAQWLDVDQLGGMQRDPAVYPNLPGDLGELLQAETRAFVKALFAGGGTFEELLSAPYTYVNAALAQHYDLTGASGSDFVRVDAPGRSGILTQGTMLVHDKQTRTSIVRRGLKMRIDMLCEIVPAPPPNVQLDLEGLGADLSQRERLELHRSEPACAGCHELMDPMGLVFESFDAVGRWRTVDETGRAVDTTTTITQTLDANGAVANAAELGQRLAASKEAHDCYVLQSFRFFYGRDATEADQCSMAQLRLAFEGKQHGLSELLVALTQTDAFRYRPAIIPEAAP